MDEAGLEDSAILLMSLGEEEAADVFKHLTPKEVQSLGETIARMKSIPRERVERRAADVHHRHRRPAKANLVADTDEYVRNVLRKALGEDKANLLIDRILQGGDITGIEGLKWMDAGSIGELLRNEHPQIVAAVLVHLDYDQAAAVLKTFAERQRNEVLVRIATLDGIQPSALKDLNEVMGRMLAGGEQARKAPLGGVKTAAEMINLMGTSVETAVLDYIREADNDLAQQIMDNMFTFDDLEGRRQGHPGAAEGSAVRIAGHRAQGRRRRRCARRCSRTCRRAPPRRCAKTSNRAARCASPKSRPSRRKC